MEDFEFQRSKKNKLYYQDSRLLVVLSKNYVVVKTSRDTSGTVYSNLDQLKGSLKSILSAQEIHSLCSKIRELQEVEYHG